VRHKLLLLSLTVALLFFIPSICLSYFYTDYEAKEFLRNIGFTGFIKDAELLIIAGGEIKGKGGLTIDLPILGFVNKNQIYILDYCAKGTVYDTGTIVIKTNGLSISCAYGIVGGRTCLVVGRDLKHIATNYVKKLTH